MVYDGFHQLVLTDQFNRNCAVSSKHINDLVGVARHIKAVIGGKAGGKDVYKRQKKNGAKFALLRRGAGSRT